jgi:hypothetical protein
VPIDGYQPLAPAPGTARWVAVTMQYAMVSDGVSAQQMRVRADRRPVELHWTEMNYILELDASYNILGGEWIRNQSFAWGEDNKAAHPDFLWMAIKPSAGADDTDVADGDNPYLNYQQIKSLIRCANDVRTCTPQNTPPPADPGSVQPSAPASCARWMVTAAGGLIAKCGVGPGSVPLQNLSRPGEVASSWMRNPQYGDVLELADEVLFDGTYERRKLLGVGWFEPGGDFHSWSFGDAAAARGCSAGVFVASGRPDAAESYLSCHEPR